MTADWQLQLKAKLAPVTLERPGEVEQSAVSLILRPHAQSGAPEILFIKRAERSDDPWSGHMAFPGGRRHGEDQTIAQTSVRETYEEIGLRLGAHQTLGALEAYSPRVTPELTVHPYVFYVNDVPELFLDPNEVQEVHWVPVELAFNASSFSERPYTFRGISLTLPTFSFLGRHIWGVTYVIFLDFLFALAETTWGQEILRQRNFDPKERWKYHPYR
ncbi:MAG: hypothetical protein A2X86_02220 [Bdellovibrionales bacterium GWA2_49_15]|nr:MAG: hypothetical protein A2X86_02220 [Bdellovibrionales bacterium GWA2_49_15]